MKNNKALKIFCSMLALLTVLTSCKKEVPNIFNMLTDVELEYKSTLNQGEVYVEFTAALPTSGANSTKNMSKIELTEVGSTTPARTIQLTSAQTKSYNSGVLILTSANPQTVTYNIKVIDDTNADITSLVTITYPSGNQVVNNPILVTEVDTKTVNPGDNVYLDYTLTSKKDMRNVVFETFAGNAQPTRTNIVLLPDANKNNYRGVVRINMTRNGLSRYRIYATDVLNAFIGDDYKNININVSNDHTIITNRFLYAPSLDATNQNPDVTSASFYSITTGETFNYTNGKNNSAKIDFGIYILPPVAPSVVPSLNLYTLNNPTNPMAGKYDFTDWTKRTTVFTPGITANAKTVFDNTLTSGLSIQTEALKLSSALNRTSVTNIAAGSILYFRTQEGKYGVLYVNGFTRDYLNRWFANIDVKIQK
ncbi:hypothetical protein [Pedobacter puniceum]|uniref:DUF1735 domain-containing protein n=1 Tax=Pedobacter puniceum TaxID=2666136 RepID=A0A7K0FJV2_9SPHI|nr:hypothetical protein [Pedobacter puniceum]MRX46188.1 hypothetical protein [Pedobacter puniceum]